MFQVSVKDEQPFCAKITIPKQKNAKTYNIFYHDMANFSKLPDFC